MFGNLGNMAGMMKKVQEAQKRMKEIQAELPNLEFKGVSENGMVEVIASGDLMVKSIVIKQDCIKTADPDIVGEEVMSAVNTAIAAARAGVAEKMKDLTGGMDIPGL